MHRRIRNLGLACAAVLSGSAALRVQAALAPCALLTSAQVSAALKVTVGAGIPIADTGCTWTAPKVMASLSLSDASHWEKMKAPLPGITRTPIALGDDAFFTVLGEKAGAGGMPILTVKKDGTAYVFKVYTRLRSVDEQMDIEKALATNALAAL